MATKAKTEAEEWAAKPTENPRRTEALAIITKLQRRAGPSIRQVAAEMGVAGNAVQRYVHALRAAGKVEVDSGDGIVLCRAPEPILAGRTRQPIRKPNGAML